MKPTTEENNDVQGGKPAQPAENTAQEGGEEELTPEQIQAE